MKRSQFFAVLSVITVLGLVVRTSPIPAAAAAEQAPAQSRGLTVVPPNSELDGKAGQTIERTITVTNSSVIEQHLSMSVRNFKPLLEDGQAAPTQENSSYSMASWITVVPTSFDLKAGESRDVKATIAIPTGAEAGSHFGSVIFTPTVPNSKNGAFQTTTEVASMILLRLPGATNEASSLASFDAKVVGSNRGPVDFTTRITNEGSVHFNPTGKITVTNTFGKTVATIPVNTENHPVLPGATRKFDTRWNTGTLNGFYKAKLHLTYASNVPGTPDKVLTAETSFYSLPMSLIAATSLPILALVTLVLVLMTRARKRKT